MKIKKIHIDNYKIFHDFTIDFTNKGEVQNLIVLAGENGSGKSTLMRDVMVSCMQAVNTGNYAETEPGVFKIGGFTIETTANHHFSMVMDILEDTENDVNQTKQIILRYIDKLIFEHDMRSTEAYQKVNNLLNDIFGKFNLHIQFRGLTKERDVIFRNGNDDVKLENLSSGERMLITRAFSLFLNDYRDTVIMIDEPESSLHPDWQSRITSIYQSYANENNNQIIISTHSPQVLASVRREQIRLLTKDENGNPVVVDNFMGAYGWRVDKILTDIFGVKNLRAPEIEDKLSRLNELLENDNYENEEFKQIYHELEQDLGFSDNDLILIRLEAARRKMKK